MGSRTDDLTRAGDFALLEAWERAKNDVDEARRRAANAHLRYGSKSNPFKSEAGLLRIRIRSQQRIEAEIARRRAMFAKGVN